MTKTIFATFSDRNNAEMAIDQLKTKGFNPKDISIVMKDKKEGEAFAKDTGTGVAGGAVSGATTGAVIGGIAGLLASFVIPGLGAFFIGGPIATALGLTGAAASTVSGATTGAVAGGLLGALMGLGLSEDDAKTYEEQVNEGAILVAIPATDTQETVVNDILNSSNAENIKSVEAQQEDRIESRSTQARSADMNTETRDQDYSHDQSYARAYAGAKGGKTGGNSGKKGGRSRGWFGDSEGHSRAAKKRK